MLMFWLGGVVATAAIVIGEAIGEDAPLDTADLIPVLLWPIGLIMFIVDMARGERP